MRSEGKELEKYFIKEMGEAEGVSPPSFDTQVNQHISCYICLGCMSICVDFQIKLPPLFAFRVPMREFENVFVIQVDEERRRIQSDKERRPELKARCMIASSDLHRYLLQLTWGTIRHPFFYGRMD